MFEKLATRIKRKAKGAIPSRHRAIFYDVRISSVEPDVQRVRMGWILGKGRPEQWSVPRPRAKICDDIYPSVR